MTARPAGDDDRALIVIGGDAPDPNVMRSLPSCALVIAADSGLDHALRHGLVVDIAVGDFDSVSPEGIAAAAGAGTRMEAFPQEKDHTDLELALRVALDAGVKGVVVVGGSAGRFDHLLGNVLLLGARDLAHALDIEAYLGTARVRVVTADRAVELLGDVGEVVSLFAVGGPARGVHTTGLHYPLDGDELVPGSTRGLSNVHTEPVATVRVGEGVVLAVHPGATG